MFYIVIDKGFNETLDDIILHTNINATYFINNLGHYKTFKLRSLGLTCFVKPRLNT